jgi:hypothetical protein
MARLRRSGCGTKRFEDDRDGARIAQIEHRRCDISVAARSTPPKLRQERHHRGLGVSVGHAGFYRDFAPTGLGVFLAVSRSTEMARLRRSGCGARRFEDDRDGARIAQIEHRRCDISVAVRATPPKAPSGAASQRAWGVFWAVGFYRDFAPTGLGVLLAVSRATEMARLRRSGCGARRFEDDRDGARIAQIEHRRCDISVAVRAPLPKAPSGAASQRRLTGADNHPDSLYHHDTKRPNAECEMRNAEQGGWSTGFKVNFKRTRETAVAQVSKPAPPIPIGRVWEASSVLQVGNPRYARLGSLRYDPAMKCPGSPLATCERKVDKMRGLT